jgi:hypothetical protein
LTFIPDKVGGPAKVGGYIKDAEADDENWRRNKDVEMIGRQYECKPVIFDERWIVEDYWRVSTQER